MRKKLLALFAVLAFTLAGTAQESCQKTYLGFGSGLESPTGMIGFTAEGAIGKQFAIDGAIGISGWGFRYTGGIKYYTKECYRGLALGMAWSRSSGLPEIELDMEVDGGQTETVTMEYFPQDNVQLSVYRYWPIKQRARFHLQAGYSINVSPKNYKVLSDHQLSQFSKDVMKITIPGGLILAAGFSFGI
jgi:hypothetical protein